MEESETKYLNIFEFGKYSEILQLSDAKLRTHDGCTFDVHRVMLAICSEYFRAMFCRMNRNRKEFFIPGISGECLSDILRYIYTKDLTISEKNVRDLLIGADYLMLDDLFLKIKQSIRANMTESNCLGIFQVALQICDENISKESFRYIQTRFEMIMHKKPSDVADLPLEILERILGNRSLYVYGEETVWQAIVEWTLKDVSSRMRHVPRLLHYLAVKEVDETLAKNILKHRIVLDNSSMEDISKIKSSNFCTTYRDVFSAYFRGNAVYGLESLNYRIPIKLHVISSLVDDEDMYDYCELYITYDENPDLWCKITDTDLLPDFLAVVGHNIYIFEITEGICRKFDLRSMQWVPMESFEYDYVHYGLSIVTIDTFIYVLGEAFDEVNTSYKVELYNTASDKWVEGVPLKDISHGRAVAIENNIYVVGNDNAFTGMAMQVFNPVTCLWTLLLPPLIHRSKFALVAYKKKIYVIGGSMGIDIADVEVFDPATNAWKMLPDLPFTSSWIDAVVMNDSMIVYDDNCEDENNPKHVYWNDEEERWERVERAYPLKNLHRHIFCSMDDDETIRLITKRNRNPAVEFERSPFY